MKNRDKTVKLYNLSLDSSHLFEEIKLKIRTMLLTKEDELISCFLRISTTENQFLSINRKSIQISRNQDGSLCDFITS